MFWEYLLIWKEKYLTVQCSNYVYSTFNFAAVCICNTYISKPMKYAK
jgi:hypothetical protein